MPGMWPLDLDMTQSPAILCPCLRVRQRFPHLALRQVLLQCVLAYSDDAPAGADSVMGEFAALHHVADRLFGHVKALGSLFHGHHQRVLGQCDVTRGVIVFVQNNRRSTWLP